MSGFNLYSIIIFYDFIKLGLNDVLYNPKTKEVYTPNTNQTAKIDEKNSGNVLQNGAEDDIIQTRKYIQDPKTGKMMGSTSDSVDGTLEPSPTGSNELQNKGFASKQKLNNHWENGRTHKNEYLSDGIITAEQYEKRAVNLLESPVGGNIFGHLDKENFIIRYDKTNNDFVIGTIEKGVFTMFKPINGYAYYENQRMEDIKHGGKA